MKRLVCLLLVLAVLLPCAAVMADPEEWDYYNDMEFTIRYPDYLQLYGVPEEETGWNMFVFEDAGGTADTGAKVMLSVIWSEMEESMDWLETGAFPDEQGNTEHMNRLAMEEPLADINTGLETMCALYRSDDGKRMLEAYVFLPDMSDTAYAVTCRYPANDDGFYSDVLHWMMETLTFTCAEGESAERSNARGSFRVENVYEYDGVHQVVKDVTVDRKIQNIFWIFVESPVTKFTIEKLTWNDRTFRIKNAKKLYTDRQMEKTEVVAVFGWDSEILPTVRFSAVNADGEKEVWYVSTNEENGDIILLSEEEVMYNPD